MLNKIKTSNRRAEYTRISISMDVRAKAFILEDAERQNRSVSNYLETLVFEKMKQCSSPKEGSKLTGVTPWINPFKKPCANLEALREGTAQVG
ncbi:MAG: hypothetical protein ACJAY8_000286 [Sphingobacteriales bacterium]|jgi:hypothetical protein